MPPKDQNKSLQREHSALKKLLAKRGARLTNRGKNDTNMKSEMTRAVAAPTSLGFTTVAHSETEHRVQGMDLVSTVAGSSTTGTSLMRFSFYPAAIQNTRLQVYSSMWEKYRVNKVSYLVRTGASTALVGTYVSYVDFDPLDTNSDVSVAVRSALDHQGSVESSMYVPSIVVAGQRGQQNMLFTQRANGRTDDLLVHHTFNVIQNIPTTNATVFGSVLVNYDITFYNAVNENVLTQPQVGGWYSTGGATSANITTASPFGTTAITAALLSQTGSNLNLQFDGLPQSQFTPDFYISYGTTPTIYFFRAGLWNVYVRWVATAVTSPTMTVVSANVGGGSATKVGTDIAIGSTLATASISSFVRVVASSVGSYWAGYISPAVTLTGNASYVIMITQLPTAMSANISVPRFPGSQEEMKEQPKSSFDVSTAKAAKPAALDVEYDYIQTPTPPPTPTVQRPRAFARLP